MLPGEAYRRSSVYFLYSPNLVEGLFSEVRRDPVQHPWACRIQIGFRRVFTRPPSEYAPDGRKPWHPLSSELPSWGHAAQC
jgi:hypothetical protein